MNALSNIHKLCKLLIISLYALLFIRDALLGVLSFIAIFIHEISHIVVLKMENIKKIRFSLLGFKINLFDEKEISNLGLVYASGSIANLSLGIIFLILNLFLNKVWLYQFMVINFLIGFINLIPVFPLDGAILLKSFLNLKFKNRSFCISLCVSSILSISFFILGILLMFRFSFFNISFIIISLFMIISTYKEYKSFSNLYHINTIDNKKYLLLKNKYLKTNTISMSYDITLLEVIKLLKSHSFLIIYFVDENLKVVGVLNEYNVLEFYKEYGNVKVKSILLT